MISPGEMAPGRLVAPFRMFAGEMMGTPLATVNSTGVEPAPPLFTATETVPALASNPDGTTAVRLFALTNWVTAAELFRVTVEPLVKPDPDTVMVVFCD